MTRKGAVSAASTDPWVERVLRVCDHIHTHLDEELTPEDLADVAGFSLHHFHRVFRGMTEESVMGFVRRLRLERAAQHLRYTGGSVTDVAFASGYQSHEAFTRAFRSRFGESPSAYRDRPGIEAASKRDVQIRDVAEMHAVAWRYTGSYADCGQAWGQLMGWAGATGVIPVSQGSVGLCYDDPDVTAEPKLRYDACLVLPRATWDALGELPPRMTKRVIPSGRYAVAMHEGSFDDIFDTYIALLGRWMPRRDIELADDPVVETYLNDPATTPPEDLRTEVAVRLAAER